MPRLQRNVAGGAVLHFTNRIRNGRAAVICKRTTVRGINGHCALLQTTQVQRKYNVSTLSRTVVDLMVSMQLAVGTVVETHRHTPINMRLLIITSKLSITRGRPCISSCPADVCICPR